jgi:hypothetical protein
MSGGDSMAFAAHGRIKRDDQGRTVRASSASRNRKFESEDLFSIMRIACHLGVCFEFGSPGGRHQGYYRTPRHPRIDPPA